MENINRNKDSDKGELVSEAMPAYKLPDKKRLPFEEGKKYTYEEYREFPDYIDGIPVKYELIEGIPIIRGMPDWWREEGAPLLMAQPTRKHEEINVELVRQLANFLKGKPCKVYSSNFEVCLNPGETDEITFVPDVTVVCDHSKLTDAGCNGAPDFIAEILSPSTAQRDRLVKLRLYEKYGVREYWIIEPDTELLTVYILKDGRYDFNVYDNTAHVPVHVLEGCIIDIPEVFAK